MKLSEFAEILEKAGLPVTYKAFREGNVPSLPYLVYFESLPSITGADNQASYKIRTVTVELAFERKDEELEERLEELWNGHKLFYDVQEENFIESERLFVKSYEVYLY